MATEKPNVSIADDWLEEDNLELLECWARDGYTFNEISERIGITVKMLRRWRDDYPEIKEALRKGREMVDYKVENALLKSALGYKTKEVRVTTLMRFGKVIETTKETIEKDQAPNVSAIQTWLFNRCPDKWKRNRDDILIDDEDTSIQVTVKRAATSGTKQQPDDEEWQDEINSEIEITRVKESEREEKNQEGKKSDSSGKQNVLSQEELDEWPDDWDEEEDDA